MKRILLAGASALALAVVAPSVAHAQATVIDPARIAQSAQQQIQTILQWKSQLDGMQQQHRQLRATFDAIAHTNSVQGLASSLGRLSNTVPGSGQMQGLARGVGSVAGAAAQLQGNRAFAATGNDFSAQELRRRAQGVANIQAVALQQMRASEQRIAGIDELLGQIDGQPDLQASAALGNRIGSEQAFLAAQQQQLAQLQVLQRSQEQSDAIRAEEKGRRDAEAWEARTEWAWGDQ